MPRALPIVPEKDSPRWLYEILRHLGDQARATQVGLDAINRGEAPDGSGSPLLDLTKYFYKPGISGGQLAYGGTASADYLKLSSTAHSTKGKIYLGDGLISAYDEHNNRLGIKTASPSAVVEVDGEVATSTTYQATSSTGGGYQRETGSNTNLYLSLNEITPDDTTYITDAGNFSSTAVNLIYASVTPIATSGTFTVSYRFRWNGNDAGAGGVGIHCQLNDGNNNTIHNASNTIKTAHGSGDTGFVTFTFTLTPTEIGNIANWSNMTVSISCSGGGTGYDTTTPATCQWSWVSITTSGGGTGVGTGAINLLLKANSAQTADLQEWQSSAGTILGFVTVGGALTINGLTVRDPTTPTKALTLALSGLNTATSTLAASTTAARTWTLPDQTGTLAIRAPILDGLNNTDTVAHTVVLGDLVYGNATPAWQALAGNTTSTRKFLRQVGTGSVSAAPAWDTLTIADIPAGVGTKRFEWRANGPYRVGTSVDGQVRVPSGFTITSVYLFRITAGSSGSTIVDVNKNGVTLFTTQANRPTVTAAGGNSQASSGTLPDVTSVSAGDYLSIDIDQIEGGHPHDFVLIIEGA